MPVYTTECRKCGKTEEIFRTIATMDDLPVCCGEKTHRIIVGVHAIPDITPYKSMATGEMITSRSQHREHLKRHNLYEIGNEVNAHLKSREPKQPDRETRKRQIAQSLYGKGF